MMAGIGVNVRMLTKVMSYQKDDGWHWSERADVDESHCIREMPTSRTNEEQSERQRRGLAKPAKLATTQQLPKIVYLHTK